MTQSSLSEYNEDADVLAMARGGEFDQVRPNESIKSMTW